MNFVLYELCYYKLCLLLNFLTYKLEIINFVTEPHWPSCSVPAVLSHLFCPSCLAPANLFTLFASYVCKNTKSKSFVSTLKLSLKQWGGGGEQWRKKKDSIYEDWQIHLVYVLLQRGIWFTTCWRLRPISAQSDTCTVRYLRSPIHAQSDICQVKYRT
jgi:hypothetical protein